MTNATLKQLIDRAGQRKAESADRELAMAEIKKALIKAGVESAEGDLFRVTIAKTERALLDMDAVREKLTQQFITAHTVISRSTAMRVTARTAEGES